MEKQILRWSEYFGKKIPSDKIDSFMRDILAVYSKHKMSISHEDEQGSFIIEELLDDNIFWVEHAGVSNNLSISLGGS